MNCPGRFNPLSVAAGLLAATIGTSPVPAQPAEGLAAGPRAVLAATPETLWLLEVERDRTQAFRRGVSGSFDDVAPLNASVREAVAGPRRLSVFTAEGRFLSLSERGWSPELDLPGRVIPEDIIPAGADLLALTPSPEPGALPQLVAGELPATSQPFEPHGAALSLLRYGHRGWAAVSACPDGVTGAQAGEVRPRLAVVREHVCLFWRSATDERLVWSQLTVAEPNWSEPRPLPIPADVDAFWVARVAGVVTLIVAHDGNAGDRTLAAYRLLAGAEVAEWTWRPTSLDLSGLPADARAQEYVAAAGFNQHLALLVRDDQGREYLQFGRFGVRPVEATLLVRDVFEGRLGPARGPQWVQTLTMLALFAVLFALIVLRRGAMVQTLPLPKGLAPAFAFQRLLGLAVDLVPFALVFAALAGVNVQAALRELFGWAIGQDARAGGLPPADVLLWWGGTAGAYVMYSMILEMVFGRTIGKVVTGTRVLSESAEPPGIAQIAARNLLRGVELLPPMWILGFLVVLSRNRQRMGDIFARTIVVRRVAEREEREKPKGPEE